jgi:hypothetical protein
VLGVDLASGEAALCEAGGCRLHIVSGCIKVWDTGCQLAPAAGDAAAASAGAEASSGSTHAPVAGTPPTGTAAAAQLAGEDPFGDDADGSNTARAAAAEAATAAAEAAAAAAEAAEAAAAAALAAVPKPIAAGIAPRLFVVDARSGAGYELLEAGSVGAYEAAGSARSHTFRHLCEPALGTQEPGTLCHTFLSTYSCASHQLRPLPLAQPSRVLPAQPDAAHDLLGLRRATAVCPPDEARPGSGLLLPRVAALNPWSTLPGGAGCAAAAASSACTQSPHSSSRFPATRVPGGSSSQACYGACVASARGVGASQVVVVREVLELPAVSPEVHARVADVVAACQAQR